MSNVKAGEEIKEVVRRRYGEAAASIGEQAATGCCTRTQDRNGCCPPSGAAAEVSETAAGLYSGVELTDLPTSAVNASMGCGNPVAIAELRLGEVVLDLGSGGGIDCFLAAKRVGAEGHVYGLDMTPEMVKLARRNAEQMGATNVEFRQGEMEEIPLPDESVDVIISNCVINLSPDKEAVFNEAYRVLRPGGRLMVSDIVIHGELPESVRKRLDVWANCVAGALVEAEYLERIRSAGFSEVQVLARDYVKISAFPGWEPARSALTEAGLSPETLDRTVVSARVRAYKPD